MVVLAALFLLFLLFLAFVVTFIISRKESEAEKKRIIKAWVIIIACIINIPIILYLISPFWTQMKIDRSDNYGTYVIDREMFRGKQADWQYNHYRFEIKEDNTFLFYVTDNEKIVKTYKGYVTFHVPKESSRIAIHMELPSHHILESNPTLCRDIWSFQYIFYSKYYGNMFFTKGKWEKIDD